MGENIPNISRLLTSLAAAVPSRRLQSDCHLCKSERPQLFQKPGNQRENGGQQKVQKGEREEKREEQEVAKGGDGLVDSEHEI